MKYYRCQIQFYCLFSFYQSFYSMTVLKKKENYVNIFYSVICMVSRHLYQLHLMYNAMMPPELALYLLAFNRQ